MIGERPQTTAFMPFRKAFEGSIRTGRKTATTRSKAYGKPGQRLRTDFGDILLIEVNQMELGEVKRTLWKEEGCENAEHFQGIWRSLHRGHWDGSRMVWIHRFEFIGE